MASIDSFASQQAFLEHVVALVQQLYNPHDPQQVESVQAELQTLQRGPSAWLIGNALLGHPDRTVQFFGALTLTIKINQDAASLDDGSMQSLRDQILSWIIAKVGNGECDIVVRKLCSSLVTFSAQKNASWDRLVRHVVCCFSANKVVSEDVLEQFPPTEQLVSAFNSAQVPALLALTTILAEDAGRVPHNPEYASFHAIIKRSVEDAVAVMTTLFRISSTHHSEYQPEILHCYQSWNVYARDSFSASSEEVELLHQLLSPLMNCLEREDMFQTTAEFFIDVFVGFGSFVISKADSAKFSSFLQTDWAQEKAGMLAQPDPDEEAIIFAQLALAFGQVSAKELVQAHEGSGPTLHLMHRLTRAQSGTDIDRGLADAVCDFWDMYTVNLPPDDSTDPAEQAAFVAAKGHWMQAIEELCTVSVLPMDASGEFVVLKSDDPLSEFRFRVRSSIQATYNDLGAAVLHKLVTMATAVGEPLISARCVVPLALVARDADSACSDLPVDQERDIYSRLETILFCLADLSTSMQYHPGHETEEKMLLEGFFASSLFAALTDLAIRVPTRLRRRAIAIIGDQDDFFKRNASHLMAAIDMLFAALRHPDLADGAAQAIYKLADSGRKHFVDKVVPFCASVPDVLSSTSLSEVSKENFVAAVAFALQAMPTGEAQASLLGRMVDVVISNAPDPLTGLQQLKAVGTAVQAPSDFPINLDDADEPAPPQNNQFFDFVNQKVISFVAAMLGPRSSDDGRLLEAACDVVRTGYKESPPGYFIFHAAVTADLVASAQLSNNRLDYAISTAAAFLSSRTAAAEKSHDAKLRLASFVHIVIDHLGTPNADPEIAHASVDFIARLVPIHIGTLSELPPQHTTRMFEFTLQCLLGADMLPKKASVNLWSAIVGLSSSQKLYQDLIQSMGPVLTQTLIFNFGGNAVSQCPLIRRTTLTECMIKARSELEGLSGVLRKLVFREPLTKGWAESALHSPNFPSKRVSDEDKKRFLAQVMQCRGDKKTDSVVKNFWTQCRGTPAGYS